METHNFQTAKLMFKDIKGLTNGVKEVVSSWGIYPAKVLTCKKELKKIRVRCGGTHL